MINPSKITIRYYMTKDKYGSKEEAVALGKKFNFDFKNDSNKIQESSLKVFCRRLLDNHVFNLGKVENQNLIMLDIDNNLEERPPLSLTELISLFKTTGLMPVVISESMSSTEAHPKYHVLFMMDEPASSTEEYDLIIKGTVRLLNIHYPGIADHLPARYSGLIYGSKSIVYEDYDSKLPRETMVSLFSVHFYDRPRMMISLDALRIELLHLYDLIDDRKYNRLQKYLQRDREGLLEIFKTPIRDIYSLQYIIKKNIRYGTSVVLLYKAAPVPNGPYAMEGPVDLGFQDYSQLKLKIKYAQLEKILCFAEKEKYIPDFFGEDKRIKMAILEREDGRNCLWRIIPKNVVNEFSKNYKLSPNFYDLTDIFRFLVPELNFAETLKYILALTGLKFKNPEIKSITFNIHHYIRSLNTFTPESTSTCRYPYLKKYFIQNPEDLTILKAAVTHYLEHLEFLSKKTTFTFCPNVIITRATLERLTGIKIDPRRYTKFKRLMTIFGLVSFKVVNIPKDYRKITIVDVPTNSPTLFYKANSMAKKHLKLPFLLVERDMNTFKFLCGKYDYLLKLPYSKREVFKKDLLEAIAEEFNISFQRAIVRFRGVKHLFLDRYDMREGTMKSKYVKCRKHFAEKLEAGELAPNDEILYSMKHDNLMSPDIIKEDIEYFSEEVVDCSNYTIELIDGVETVVERDNAENNNNLLDALFGL